MGETHSFSYTLLYFSRQTQIKLMCKLKQHFKSSCYTKSNDLINYKKYNISNFFYLFITR